MDIIDESAGHDFSKKAADAYSANGFERSEQGKGGHVTYTCPKTGTRDTLQNKVNSKKTFDKKMKEAGLHHETSSANLSASRLKQARKHYKEHGVSPHKPK